MMLNGAQILIESLISQGVDTVFGYPGGAVLNIYNALHDYQDQIRHVLTSHEQGAAHAADGYARTSGRTGVVIATSGPGATNLVTGIATAYLDSVPLVAITGNVPLDLMGRDSFQEVDITGITMPITKHNFIVKRVEDMAAIVQQAFTIANSGRPGPVLIDIPKDITAKQAVYTPLPRYTPRPDPEPDPQTVATLRQWILTSERPLIYAGGGVVSADAAAALQELSRRANIPVCTSIMGLTAMPADDIRFLGMVGMHGTPAANYATHQCDLLLAIGTRFSDRVAGKRDDFAQDAKIVHIDIDASEIDKNILTQLAINGDAATVLEMLLADLPTVEHPEWVHQLVRYKAQNPLPAPDSDGCLNPRDVLTQLANMAGPEAIIATDVGQHQMFTAQYYPFSKPRSLVSSCGLGTMGYGMGAAIGAKVANPERPVILVTGDGSFHMNMNELATAVSERLPIVILIMNNQVLGMVRQWQTMFYQSRYSETSLGRRTDYVQLAAAFGGKGLRICDKSETRATLQEALAVTDGPVVIECVTHCDNNVFPMIPPGGSARDIIFTE